MTHTPVTSSNIVSLAHEGDVLEVRFRCSPCLGKGKVAIGPQHAPCPKCKGTGWQAYRYTGVPKSLHDRVLAGEPEHAGGKVSVGAAFHRLVRAKYGGEKA